MTRAWDGVFIIGWRSISNTNLKLEQLTKLTADKSMKTKRKQAGEG